MLMQRLEKEKISIKRIMKHEQLAKLHGILDKSQKLSIGNHDKQENVMENAWKSYGKSLEILRSN